MGEPTRHEIEEFIRNNDIDERAAGDLRNCSGEIQRKVLARGELSTARNPSAAVLARIRDARSSPSGGGGGGGGGGHAGSGEVEDFIKHNDVDESAADMLRSSSPTIQRAVLSRGELKTARNPSSALLSRIRDAKLGIPGGPPDRDRDHRDRDRDHAPPPSSMPAGMPGMAPPAYGYPYGMYPGYPAYPGYPGYPAAPQPDGRYGGGMAPPTGYPGYPGYGAPPGMPPTPGGAPPAYGAYGAYGAYSGYGMPYGAPPTGYPQPPAGQAPTPQPGAAPQAAPTGGAAPGRRDRSSSSSYSKSRSRSRRGRRKARK